MKPLTSPAAAPISRTRTIASAQPMSLVTMNVVTAPPARPIIAPNERSKSCITRTTVRPTAMISDGAARVRIDFRVFPVGKVPAAQAEDDHHRAEEDQQAVLGEDHLGGLASRAPR